MGTEKKEILATPKKIIGTGARLSIQHLTKRLQREYGEGTLIKGVLKTIEGAAKKINNS